MKIDHYEVLGVDKEADQKTIKKAYKKRAKETHPDTGTDTSTDFNTVNEAYRILSNPVKRKEYDDTGHNESNDDCSIAGEAKTQLFNIFKKIIEETLIKSRSSFSFVDWDSYKPSIIQSCDKIVEGFNDNLEKVNKEIEVLKSFVDRCSYDNDKESNMYEDAVKDSILQREVTKAQLNRNIKVWERVITYLEDYDWSNPDEAMDRLLETDINRFNARRNFKITW